MLNKSEDNIYAKRVTVWREKAVIIVDLEKIETWMISFSTPQRPKIIHLIFI